MIKNSFIINLEDDEQAAYLKEWCKRHTKKKKRRRRFDTYRRLLAASIVGLVFITGISGFSGAKKSKDLIPSEVKIGTVTVLKGGETAYAYKGVMHVTEKVGNTEIVIDIDEMEEYAKGE